MKLIYHSFYTFTFVRSESDGRQDPSDHDGPKVSSEKWKYGLENELREWQCFGTHYPAVKTLSCTILARSTQNLQVPPSRNPSLKLAWPYVRIANVSYLVSVQKVSAEPLKVALVRA
jgi:hypothetical protein